MMTETIDFMLKKNIFSGIKDVIDRIGQYS